MIRQEFDALYNAVANNPWEGHAHETYGWWTQQHPDELWWLIERLNALQPKKALEIGSAHGGTLVFWDRLIGKGGTTISVDMWQHHGVTLDFSSSHSNVILLRADSHSPHILGEVSGLCDGQVDFLFIDGDHTYEGVKQDYIMFSPLVRKGGIIAFHDIVYDTDIQVRRFFQEIEGHKDTIELVHGIGVVYK